MAMSSDSSAAARDSSSENNRAASDGYVCQSVTKSKEHLREEKSGQKLRCLLGGFILHMVSKKMNKADCYFSVKIFSKFKQNS